MKRMEHQSWLSRFGGYILIPHELLHVVGYRLMGKECRYEWGNSYVTPIGRMTRRQDLIGMLFPFTVFLMFLTSFAILAGFASEQVVRDGSFFWFIFWLTLAYIAGFYVCTAIGDLRRAYLLITKKPWYSWTPFDFFFLPFVNWDDVRKKVASGEIDDKQD